MSAAFEASLSAATRLSEGLTETVSSIEAAAGKVSEANTALGTSTSALEGAANATTTAVEQMRQDQDTHRVLATAVGEAAAELRTTQAELDTFLRDLGTTLTQAHTSFGEQVTATLSSTHSEAHAYLADATKAIAGAVSDLRQFVEEDFQEAVENFGDGINGLQKNLARLAPATEA